MGPTTKYSIDTYDSGPVFSSITKTSSALNRWIYDEDGNSDWGSVSGYRIAIGK